MSVNSELAALNSVGNGQLGNLPDSGVSTGFNASGYGVSFDADATNSLGSINATSDAAAAEGTPPQDFTGSGHDGEKYCGCMGGIDASSHAPTDLHAN